MMFLAKTMITTKNDIANIDNSRRVWDNYGRDHDFDNEHDDDVTSVSFVPDTPLDLDKFEIWCGNLLRTHGQDILRSKGIIEFSGVDERYVFQGVHMLMDASPMGAWPDGKPRNSRMVFIGRNLETMNLMEVFEGCKAV